MAPSMILESLSFLIQGGGSSVWAATAGVGAFLFLGWWWWYLHHHRHYKYSNPSGSGPAVSFPRRLPSQWPYVGIAVALGQDLLGCLRRARSYAKDEPIIEATLLGQTVYLIVDPAHLDVVNKYDKSRFVDEYAIAKQFMLNVFQAKPKDLDWMYVQHVEDALQCDYQLFHQHIFQTQAVATNVTKLQALLDTALREKSWETTWSSEDEETSSCLLRQPKGQPYATDPNVVHLHHWVRELVWRMSVGPLLGQALADPRPHAYRLARTLPYMTLLFQGMPHWCLPSRVRADLAALQQAAASPTYNAQGSPLTQDRARNHAAHGAPLDVVDKAKIGLHVAASANSIDAIFWTLWHLSQQRDTAWEACRAQILSIVPQEEGVENSATNPASSFTLEQLDQMTLLLSAFTESLRLYQRMWSVRHIVQDWPLRVGSRTFLLRKGARLMGLPALKHMDPQYFDDPETFRYDRFVNTNKVSSAWPAHTQFWGGGRHMCPGRKFIRYEALAFLARIVRDYRLELVDGATREPPSLDPFSLGTGVATPQTPVWARITLRSSKETDVLPAATNRNTAGNGSQETAISARNSSAAQTSPSTTNGEGHTGPSSNDSLPSNHSQTTISLSQTWRDFVQALRDPRQDFNAFVWWGRLLRATVQHVYMNSGCDSCVVRWKLHKVWRPLVPYGGLGIVSLVLLAYYSSLRHVIARRWCCIEDGYACEDISNCIWMRVHDVVVAYLGFMIVFHYLCTVFRSPGVALPPTVNENDPPCWKASEGQGGMMGWNASCRVREEKRRVALYGPKALADYGNEDSRLRRGTPGESGSPQYFPSPDSTYCHKCKMWRPPRCHHCSVSQRCVLQYDHHCMWVNQCIGYNNYRSFVAMLFFLMVGCWYGVALLFQVFYEPFREQIRELGWKWLYSNGTGILDLPMPHILISLVVTGNVPPKMLVDMVYPLLLGLGAVFSLFLGYHVKYILLARTTLEHSIFLETELAAVTSRGQSRTSTMNAVVNPFDQGKLRNLQQILGKRMFLVLLPVIVDPPPPYMPQTQREKTT